jgi:hypothetical protein
LTERTFLAASHIRHLKLGSRLRRIDGRLFASFPTHLAQFDVSDVTLSEMTSDSRCHLIHYIGQMVHVQRQSNVMLPRLDHLTPCDCARLFLDQIGLVHARASTSSVSCSEQCQFSDCPTISEFFRRKFSLLANESPPTVNSSNGRDGVLPSVDLLPDHIDVELIRFLMNQRDDEQMQPDDR